MSLFRSGHCCCVAACVLLLALSVCAPCSGNGGQPAGSPTPSASSSPEGELKRVIKSTMSALFKLHTLVDKYEGELKDSRTRALLLDCLDLTDDSKDVVNESMSILLKLHTNITTGSSSSSSSSRNHNSDNGQLLRTNLSAALTDVSTCTDGLHDELTDDSKETRKAVVRIFKQAARVSQLLSRALSLAISIQN